MFKDRSEAGELLSRRLEIFQFDPSFTTILALPRGGVPVAWQVAKNLNLPMEILAVKKIPHPQQTELALGAVTESGTIYWDDPLIEWLRLDKASLIPISERILKRLKVTSSKWRTRKSNLKIKDGIFILIDDGLATGSTMIAAIQMLKSQGAKRVFVAVPVGSQEAIQQISQLIDDVVVLRKPTPFHSVGHWYADFTQVTDQEVRDILNQVQSDQDQFRQVSGGI